MKTTLLAALLAACCALGAHAQLYKYVDKDGKTVYSDVPPTNIDSKQVKPVAPPAAAPKTAVERDKELDKVRKEAREKQEKADKAAKGAEEQERACTQAKSAYRTYSDGGRVYKVDEKGERVYMEEAEMEQEKQRAKAAMDEACRRG